MPSSCEVPQGFSNSRIGATQGGEASRNDATVAIIPFPSLRACSDQAGFCTWQLSDRSDRHLYRRLMHSILVYWPSSKMGILSPLWGGSSSMIVTS